MSDGDWSREDRNRRLTFAFLSAVIVSLIVYGFYEIEHQEERNHASEHAKKERLVECAASESVTIALACAQEYERAPYERSEGYYDLKAQQDMAKWALLMLVVTSIGVFYIAQTLTITSDTLAEAEKTSKAATAANKIASQTQRPWVCIEDVKFEVSGYFFRSEARSETEMDKLVCKISFVMRNIGYVPALSITAFGLLVCDEELTAYSEKNKEIVARTKRELIKNAGRHLVPGGSEPATLVLHANAKAREMEPRIADINPRLTLVVAYQIPGDDDIKITAQQFSVGERQSADNVSIRPLSLHRIFNKTTQEIMLVKIGLSMME